MEQLDLFYNTPKLSGEILQKHKIRNESQNHRILLIFEHRGESTPSEIWHYYQRAYGNIPLTSIRRGITTLTKCGLLEKTDNKRRGLYDVQNFTWKLT